MMQKKSVLIVCNSDLSREPRVIRQIIALKADYNITTIGVAPSAFKEVNHISFIEIKESPKHWNYHWVIRKLYSAGLQLYEKGKKLYPKYYYHKDFWTLSKQETIKQLEGKKFDLVIAHHWDSLPLGYHLAKKMNAKLIYNVHDYYSRQFEDNPVWVKHQQPLVQYLTDKYVPGCDFIFSAWSKIHEDYMKLYNVPSVIINNATEFNDLSPVMNQNEKKIRLIHHGIANSNRKIELMIEMMDYLDDRFTLDLMLINSPYEINYFYRLKKMAENNSNIRFIEPVPTREIAKTINGYDIGVFILPPNGFNPTFLLPNKLFEFIQARLACLITPNVEMKVIVEKYDLGWIAKDFEPQSVAAQIRNIAKAQIIEKKENVHRHAYELSAEINYKKMREVVNTLLKQSDHKQQNEKVLRV